MLDGIIHKIGERTEQIGEYEYRNSKVVRFEGKTWVVSDKTILTVVALSACNSACQFCSNGVTFTPRGRYLKWGSNHERLMRFCFAAQIEKVAFTGGEPTLNPEALLALAGPFFRGVKKCRLHSNGFRILAPVKGSEGPEPLVVALVRAGLNGLSLSVAHHDRATNEQVMRHGTRWAGLDDEAIRRAVTLGGERGLSIRLSCVMTHIGVRCVKDIDHYLAWGRSLGVKRFIFRSCSPIPAEYSQKSSFSKFSTDNWIDIRPIIRVFAGRTEWTSIFSQEKTDSFVHVFRHEDGTVVDLDESSEQVDPDPKVRRLILMPDGYAYTSWLDNRTRLFENPLENDAFCRRRSIVRVDASQRTLAVRPYEGGVP